MKSFLICTFLLTNTINLNSADHDPIRRQMPIARTHASNCREQTKNILALTAIAATALTPLFIYLYKLNGTNPT